MFKWIESFKNADKGTKAFVFNCFVYGFIIVASTIYCYSRLDFVRTGTQTQTPIEK